MGETLSEQKGQEHATPEENPWSILEAAEQQEILNGAQIVERAEDNINKLAQDLAEKAQNQYGEIPDMDEQYAMVGKALETNAINAVSEIDADGMRTNQEQSELSEVFQTAVVFGAVEKMGGIAPEENLVTKLYENPQTTKDLGATINELAETGATLEDGKLLSEDAASIIFEASFKKPEQSAEAQQDSVQEADSEQDVEAQQESTQDAQEAEDADPEKMEQQRRKALAEQSCALYIATKASGLSQRISAQTLLNIYDSIAQTSGDDEIKQEIEEIKNTDQAHLYGELLSRSQDILQKVCSGLNMEDVLSAETDGVVSDVVQEDLDSRKNDPFRSMWSLENAPSETDGADEEAAKNESLLDAKRVLISEIDSGDEGHAKLIKAYPDIVKAIGIDEAISLVNVFDFSDWCNFQAENQGKEYSDDARQKITTRISEGLINKHFEEVVANMPEIDDKLGAEAAGKIRSKIYEDVQVLLDGDKFDKDWLQKVEQWYGRKFDRLVSLQESGDEQMEAFIGDARSTINENIRNMDLDAVVDVCLSENTNPDFLNEIEKTTGVKFDYLLRMRGSSSPELARYSEQLFRGYWSVAKELASGETSAEDESSLDRQMEGIISTFESDIPSYRKLALAEKFYRNPAIMDERKKRFIESDLLALFPEVQVDDDGNYDDEKLDILVRADLLTSSVRSNNLQLRSYLQEAVDLMQKVNADGPAGAVTDEQMRKAKEVADVIQDFRNAFGAEKVSTPEDALHLMDEVRLERDAAKRASVIEDPNNPGRFILKEPIKGRDPKKGFREDFLDFQFQDGFNCPEALGYGAFSDATTGDADFSASNPSLTRTEDGGARVSITEQLKNSITAGDRYGRTKAVFRQDERFAVISADNPDDSTALYRLATNQAHGQYNSESDSSFIGVRTGLGALDVDAFIVHDGQDKQTDYDREDLKRLKFEIVKSGCYTPIVGEESETVIFTPQEYDEMRQKVLNGVSVYDMPGSETREFVASDNIEIDDAVLQKLGITDMSYKGIMDAYDQNILETTRINNEIITRMQSLIESSDVSEETKQAFMMMTSSLERTNPFSDTPSAMVFGTGSTARGANVLGDGDYDFMICLDEKLLEQDRDKIVDLFYSGLGDGQSGRKELGAAKGLKMGIGSTEVDVDITLRSKNDRMKYSTDVVLGRFYEDLAAEDSRNKDSGNDTEYCKKVIANVQIGKKLLKKYGCYKKENSQGAIPGQGGIGGIGVENLILQSNGSLHDAAQSFVTESRAAVKEMLGVSDEEVDGAIRAFIASNGYKEGQGGQQRAEMTKAFSRFRNGFMLFDRGQNFENINKRLSKKSQREGSRDDYYAFDDLMSGGRFELGGWLKMYEAFSDLLEAWPGENEQ